MSGFILHVRLPFVGSWPKMLRSRRMSLRAREEPNRPWINKGRERAREERCPTHVRRSSACDKKSTLVSFDIDPRPVKKPHNKQRDDAMRKAAETEARAWTSGRHPACVFH